MQITANFEGLVVSWIVKKARQGRYTRMGKIKTSLDYQVTSVTRSEVIWQDKGESWYEYVISNAGSVITGQRQGSLKEVTRHAKEYCQQLNERMNSGASYYRSKRSVSPIANK
ncbi:MAG: hypothetical protein HUJ29_11400 [Gammaproteobacteria bacterium]|nr:hypothetical protein [Gammaproteobacteria bacterium]